MPTWNKLALASNVRMHQISYGAICEYGIETISRVRFVIASKYMPPIQRAQTWSLRMLICSSANLRGKFYQNQM